MNPKSILITGTDTAVGKTTVACGLAASLSLRGRKVGVFKPAETGCEPGPDGRLQPADAARLLYFSDCRHDLETVCPYKFREPLAPLVAAQREGVDIDFDRLGRCHRQIASAHDITLIEGAGGLLVPITPTATFADLAAHLNVPLVVVVASRLGAINHALLTVRYAQAVGLRILGYVINFVSASSDRAAETNVQVLSDWLGPPLGVVPYLGEIEITQAARRHLAEVFSARLRLEAFE